MWARGSRIATCLCIPQCCTLQECPWIALTMPVALCVASNPPETMVHVVDGCRATAAKFFFGTGLPVCSWALGCFLVKLLWSGRVCFPAGEDLLGWFWSWRQASCSAHSVLCPKDLVSWASPAVYGTASLQGRETKVSLWHLWGHPS